MSSRRKFCFVCGAVLARQKSAFAIENLCEECIDRALATPHGITQVAEAIAMAALEADWPVSAGALVSLAQAASVLERARLAWAAPALELTSRAAWEVSQIERGHTL